MKHTRLLLIILIALLALPAAAQEESGPPQVGLRPDAPPYALHGPYWVGTQDFVIEDAERPLPLTVWYPAINPGSVSDEITHMAMGLPNYGHGFLNAEPDKVKAPYPLIIFSHGNYDNRFTNLFFSEHLASQGFVVISVDHTGNTAAESGQDYIPFVVYRPLDITRVIDFAETSAGGALPAVIDMSHIAVSGHSYGGMTTLQAAGAQLDIVGFDELYCSKVRAGEMTDTIQICALLDRKDELAQLAGLEAVPDGLWPLLGDPRVDAIVSFAPGGAEAALQMFGPTGLQSVNVPTLLMVGSGDTWSLPELNTLWAYENVGSSQRSLVMFEGADHFIYTNGCEALPWLVDEWGFFTGCSDPVWDMDRAHDLINHLTTAFLLDTLKGDAEAHAALLAENVAFPGITYETTMK